MAEALEPNVRWQKLLGPPSVCSEHHRMKPSHETLSGTANLIVDYKRGQQTKEHGKQEKILNIKEYQARNIKFYASG